MNRIIIILATLTLLLHQSQQAPRQISDSNDEAEMVLVPDPLELEKQIYEEYQSQSFAILRSAIAKITSITYKRSEFGGHPDIMRYFDELHSIKDSLLYDKKELTLNTFFNAFGTVAQYCERMSILEDASELWKVQGDLFISDFINLSKGKAAIGTVSQKLTLMTNAAKCYERSAECYERRANITSCLSPQKDLLLDDAIMLLGKTLKIQRFVSPNSNKIQKYQKRISELESIKYSHLNQAALYTRKGLEYSSAIFSSFLETSVQYGKKLVAQRWGQ